MRKMAFALLLLGACSADALIAPSNLTTGAVSQTEIDLAWRVASTKQTGFEVMRSRDGSTFNKIATLGKNATRYQSTGLLPATLYYYKVRAVRFSAVSAFSNTSSAKTKPSPAPTPTPTPAPPTPSPTTTPTATPIPSPTITPTPTPASGSIGLKWDAVPGAAGYKIYFGTATGRYFAPIDVGNVTTARVPNLASGTTYYLAITAYNSAVESAKSTEVSGQPGRTLAIKHNRKAHKKTERSPRR